MRQGTSLPPAASFLFREHLVRAGDAASELAEQGEEILALAGGPLDGLLPAGGRRLSAARGDRLL
jgi:hypothetical protein